MAAERSDSIVGSTLRCMLADAIRSPYGKGNAANYGCVHQDPQRECRSVTAADEPLREQAQILIAGGGIAGLEAMMALRELAEDRLVVTLVAPDPEFLYKPLVVEEPFTSQPAERRELAPIAEEFGAPFLQRAITELRPHRHAAELDDGSELAYDAAVVCVGARQRPAYRSAISFELTPDPLAIDRILTDSAEADPGRLAFVVPPGVTWALPIYELALLSRRRSEELGIGDLELLLVTPETAPLALFGRLASDAVTELLRARGIRVLTGAYAREGQRGELVLSPSHEVLEAAAVIALPLLDGPRVRGLPWDEDGFIRVDDRLRVEGVDDVYAAGDGTTFPIKQGGIGTQQADAAAEQIAARAGAPIEPQPFRPVLRGKLLTGYESLNLRAPLAGGEGEGVASPDYLWWPPHKVGGRYLAAWLARESVRFDLEPPTHSVDVEVALPQEWHSEPMALDPYSSSRVA
jgi:sulfide:quinone oxidoreductase